jgi:hypothetical protein
MSDFDEVLERLVGEPEFAAALAADPERALAGYRLSDDEVTLLHTQVGGEGAAQHAVEVRANQSSTFGMLSPLVGMFGGGGGLPGIGEQVGSAGMGHAGGGAGGGAAGQGLGPAGDSGLGQAPVDAYGSETYAGAAEPGGLASLGDRIGEGLLAADTGDSGLGAAPQQPPPQEGAAGIGDAPEEPLAPLAPPEGYRTRVDVDGDGDWDRHIAVGRADGGVDIYVDADRDGRVDFIGHDDDADRLVDSAEYDKDGDGFFEKRMHDDDGDGWMDRTTYQTPHS